MARSEITGEEYLSAAEVVREIEARARFVCNKIETFPYIPEESPIQVVLLEGDDVEVSWVESEYDSSCVEVQTWRIPARLLFCSDEEVAEYAEKIARKRREKDKAEIESRAFREAQERATLAALYKKYGGV